MFCRSTSWFICIFATAVVAANYSDPNSFTGSDHEVTVSQLRTDNLESPTEEPIQEVKDTTAVDLRPPAETSTPASGDSSSTTPHAQLLSGHSSHGQTPALAELPTNRCTIPPTDDTTVSVLRSLSGQEKGRRLIQAAEEGTVEEVQSLIAAGAHLEAREKYGRTALHWAAARGRVEAMRRLLVAGAQLEARDLVKSTPLHYAAARGHVQAVRFLLVAGAQVSAGDDLQSTPLHFAAVRGHVEVARWLIVAGADIDARDGLQSTPMHYAAKRGHADVVRLLVAFSGDTIARDVDGRTPLHWAAANGHAEAATALLEEGANRDAVDNAGKSPLALARLLNRQQLVELLART